MERLTYSQALGRIQKYCAYQERCHSEVREKLFSLGMNQEEREEIISHLIANNFLNEERFAIHFARGKFRLKTWGKLKIEMELKRKGVSGYCIRKALSQIDTAAYENTFLTLAEKKRQSLKSEKNIFIRNRKIKNFLLSKGYDAGLIYSYLKTL
ncbi:MAG: RecX family transcriptional regulator [Chitinophagaceae bacterium]|nr:RecX family transcriptional regulator [Chitinophagaceae bacterium]